MNTNSWEGLEPAPIEYMHGLLMDLFHEWRIKNFGKENLEPQINGIAFNNLIADAKICTYEKYAPLKLDQAIPKERLSPNAKTYIPPTPEDMATFLTQLGRMQQENALLMGVLEQAKKERVQMLAEIDRLKSNQVNRPLIIVP